MAVFEERQSSRFVDDDFMLIPSHKATAEEKLEQQKVMRRGNKVFHQYHERVKPFVEGRYSRTKFRKDLFDAAKANPNKIEVCGIVISQSDFALIQKVKDLEFVVLQTYARLIYKHAKKWASMDHSSSLGFGDFYNEGATAVILAMYGFVKDDIRFSTYVSHCIHRRFLNITNSSKPLSPWTQENKKLYGEFEKIRRGTGDGVEVGFDDVVTMMGLSVKEVSDLRFMLTKVISQVEFTPDKNKGEGRSDMIGIYSAAQQIKKPVIDFDQMEQIRRTPMSDWEKKVLEAYLSGGRGWASEIARNSINPETGQPYSRRAPKVALDRILGKVKENLGNSLTDAA